MGKVRNARINGEEVSDKTPEGQEVAEPNSEEEEGSDLGDDQAAELGRHVEATGDGYVVQVAGSSGAEVSGRECPVEVPERDT